MNGYAVVILAALALEFGLGLAADALNLGALGTELPPELRGVHDPETYRKAQDYTRTRTRFGLVVGAVGLLVLLGFWFLGGFDRLDRALRAFTLGPVATGVLFIGALGLGQLLIGLPFRWWSTFVIEERFGFNKTTAVTFWTDMAKGLLLAVVLGGPLLAMVLWLFDRAGSHAWLWCWLAGSIFVIVVQLVAPTWIMPLFNRFTPLDAGPLRDAILGYARGVSFPLDGVFVIDGSRRSTKANAFFTGFGRHKRIALFDTLIDTLQPAELVAVVAHEVGHYKRRHVLIGLALAIAQLGASFFLLSYVLETPGLFKAFFMDTHPVYAGLVFFGLLFTPLNLVLSVLGHALSRRHEYAADAFAVETTGAGEPLAAGLLRLSTDTLANLTPHPFYVALHYSHPPVLARVRALREGRG